MEISDNCVTLHFNTHAMEYGMIYDVSLSSVDLFIVREFYTFTDSEKSESNDFVIFTDGIREVKEFCCQRFDLHKATADTLKDCWFTVVYSSNPIYSKLIKEEEKYLSFIDLR